MTTLSSLSSHIPSTQPQWVKRFAKFGLAAKGVVYCLVGILAFMAAFEIGGRSERNLNKQGIFRFILEQPFGQILLALVAIGLVCYALWRLTQAFLDNENKGTDAKGIGRRVGYAFSGLVYGFLAYGSFRMVLGSQASQGGDTRQTLVRELLQKPFGQWLVGLIGLSIIGVGLYQIYRALSGKYLKNVQTSSIKTELKEMIIRSGKLGYIARGVVWGIIGYLFIKAAMAANASEAGGSSHAFAFLEKSSYGSYLLGAVAVGLFCYGVFMFVRARYEVINTSN
ncbi:MULTISPECIES: DUF1206 domain-containing protein [Spirosoma]|uniref:DUF1206 domain-containing protein n=1 Tax=Spirosoma sordidisoli TaxID=2502893 RepID=A0A4Q2URX7_9BACT|nr:MULTISPECIES: DUF1206 domain-containing protein [Spirosoma]RYC70485.1 DUF1206 domain-containing protein [Spirosoma sordidisoli]